MQIRLAWVMTCQFAIDVFLTLPSVVIDVTLTYLSRVDTIPPMCYKGLFCTGSVLCA